MRSALLLLALAAPAAADGPRLLLGAEDPAGDATGPGSYVAPGDAAFADGDFDLRRFAVREEGEELLLEVTFGAPIRPPDVPLRTGSTDLPLASGLYLQNVDIYVDSDPSPAAGSAACIPGRRVAFAGGRRWEAAVVLTPQPGPARAAIADALGADARRVIVPDLVAVQGRTVTARVPAAALGGRPQPGWGWAVHVSGAAWERSFRVTDRLRGTVEPDAYTMPVLGVREAWAFGGAPAGEAHPRVVDMLFPAGPGQEAALRSFDAATGAFARVPFVTLDADGHLAVAPPLDAGPAARPGAAPLTVTDLAQEMISVAGPTDGLRAMQLGRVVDAGGATVARVVVVQLVKGGLVASAVDGRDRIERGQRVLFDAPPPRAP